LLPAAELLSFLKQMHGPWTERDLSKVLNISSAEAKQVIAAMQLQGYAEPIARTKTWRTTQAGLTVSGAKTARLTRKAVEQALSALRDRIQAVNKDKAAEYTISEAVAFGDFLSEQARVQPAEVGIRLTRRNTDVDASASAVEHKAEQAFLKQLRGKTAALHIQDYEPWMSVRSHMRLAS
jgi:DNA-binding MarR family transcriptional regulator